jgi:hypothetical protein
MICLTNISRRLSWKTQNQMKVQTKMKTSQRIQNFTSAGSAPHEHEPITILCIGRFAYVSECRCRCTNISSSQHALYTALLQEIDSLSTSNGRLHGFVHVSHVKSPQDLSDADGIMTWLDERRVVEMEWQKVKTMMESARHLEMTAKKGENFEE